MAGLHRRAEEPRELRQRRAGYSTREQAPRERDRVDDGRCKSRPGELHRLAVEERHVEARVVRDEHRVAREGEEPVDGERGRRGAAQLTVAQPGERLDPRPERHPGVDERLELGLDLEPAHAHGSDLADLRGPGPQAGGLEVDDDVRRLLEQQVLAERPREPDRVAVPREPRVGLDDVGQQAASERDRGRAEREQPPGRLLGEHRPAPLLDELHQPVGRVEPELHRSSLDEHMFDS